MNLLDRDDRPGMTFDIIMYDSRTSQYLFKRELRGNLFSKVLRLTSLDTTWTLTLLTYPLHLLWYHLLYSWPRTHSLFIRCQHQMKHKPRTSVRCVPHPKVKPSSWKTNATTVFRFLWLEPSHCRRHSSEHQSY